MDGGPRAASAHCGGSRDGHGDWVRRSPGLGWRNWRNVGYHGLSLRSSSHRQHVSKRLSSHTGLPSAPARWTTDVSTVTTRSSAAMSAAVSAKSPSSCVQSCSVMPGRDPARWSAPASFCSDTKLIEGTSSSWANRSNGIERRRSVALAARWSGRGLPLQATPTRSPGRSASRCRQLAACFGSAVRYGTRSGMSSRGRAERVGQAEHRAMAWSNAGSLELALICRRSARGRAARRQPHQWPRAPRGPPAPPTPAAAHSGRTGECRRIPARRGSARCSRPTGRRSITAARTPARPAPARTFQRHSYSVHPSGSRPLPAAGLRPGWRARPHSRAADAARWRQLASASSRRLRSTQRHRPRLLTRASGDCGHAGEISPFATARGPPPQTNRPSDRSVMPRLLCACARSGCSRKASR